MKSRVIVFPRAFSAELVEVEIPSLKSGQVLTRTVYTGVSTGTETRVYSGRQMGAVFPLVPGYENIGEVVDAGPGARLRKGTHVYLTSTLETGSYSSSWGGQVEYAVQEESRVIPLPRGIDLVSAAFAHTAAIAYHGIRRGRVARRDTVAIVGQGLIGFLAGMCAKATGAEVFVVDTIDERLAAAKAAGADHIVNSAREDVEKVIRDATGGGVDVAVDVTGVAATVDKTAQLVKPRPWTPPFRPSSRVVILGSYNDPVAFSYSPTLYNNEPEILPSRDTVWQDIRDVIGLIGKGKLQPTRVPHKVVPVAACKTAYDELAERKAMRIIFSWR